MKFVFFSITEHPWGREMLCQLVDSGFIPSLIIEEKSDGGNTEREKFEFRLGSNPLAPTMKSQIEKHNIPFVQCQFTMMSIAWSTLKVLIQI